MHSESKVGMTRKCLKCGMERIPENQVAPMYMEHTAWYFQDLSL